MKWALAERLVRLVLLLAKCKAIQLRSMIASVPPETNEERAMFKAFLNQAEEIERLVDEIENASGVVAKWLGRY